MHVIITDLLIADCDLSGRTDVECVRVQLEAETPEVVIRTTELVRLLRLKKKQAGGNSQPASKTEGNRG